MTILIRACDTGTFVYNRAGIVTRHIQPHRWPTANHTKPDHTRLYTYTPIGKWPVKQAQHSINNIVLYIQWKSQYPITTIYVCDIITPSIAKRWENNATAKTSMQRCPDSKVTSWGLVIGRRMKVKVRRWYRTCGRPWCGVVTVVGTSSSTRAACCW